MGVSAQIIQLIRRRLQKDEELGKWTAPFFLIKMKQYIARGGLWQVSGTLICVP